MSICCHAKHVENYPVYGYYTRQVWFEVLAGSWSRKQTFIQRVSSRERTYWFCPEANGLVFLGSNVTCDNFSLQLTWHCDSLKRNAVFLSNATKQEVPEEFAKKKELHKTEMFQHDSQVQITLTSHQCKSKNNIAILSSVHPHVQVSSNENPKNKPNLVHYCYDIKLGVVYIIKWQGLTLWKQEVGCGLCSFFIMLWVWFFSTIGSFIRSSGRGIHAAVNTYKHGRPQKVIQGGGNVDILLIIFKLLTIQCKWTFTKRFTLSTSQRKWPMLPKKSQKCAPLAAIPRTQVYYDSLHQCSSTGTPRNLRVPRVAARGSDEKDRICLGRN